MDILARSGKKSFILKDFIMKEIETMYQTEEKERIEIREISGKEVWDRMPFRKEDSHKGTYGKLLMVAGSLRYRGAAALCAEGALRSGCGIVTLASTEPVFLSTQPRLPEAICLPCRADSAGGIAAGNRDELAGELGNGYTALLMGPGMGNTESTRQLVTELVGSARCAAILDADALNACAPPASVQSVPDAGSGSAGTAGAGVVYTEEATVLARHRRGGTAGTGVVNTEDTGANPNTTAVQAGTPAPALTPAANQPARAAFRLPHPAGAPLIITPHPGEMARLTGLSIAEVKARRESLSLAFARQQDCIVILKEHRTLIASPDGSLWRNTTGGSGLARGGSGDILAGMIGSFLAQGMDPLDASICAVWLHGAAADRCAETCSLTGMLPHDIFDALGQIFLEQNR